MRSFRLQFLLVVLAAAPATLSLWNQVQEVDPAQYVDVASRMLRSGEYFVPRDTFGPHLNKPPLMMWSEALSMAVFGQDSFGARLPALLFGLLAVWGVFRIGRLVRDAQLGWVAAALFAASTAFQHMVADPKVDMPLTAMTTLGIWAVLESRLRPRFIWLAWGFAGLAVLSKGPLGVVLPVLALLPVALRRDWSLVPVSFWRRVWALQPLGGLVTVAALAALFYVPISRASGGGAAFDLLWTQGFGRFFGQTVWVADTTPLFFLHTALWAFLPASPLVVAALVRRALAWKAKRPVPVLEQLPLFWLMLPLAMVSLPSYKLPQYIYCLAPAAALLAAQEVLALSPMAHRRWRLAFTVLGVGSVAVVGAALVWAFPGSPARLAAWVLLVLALPLGAVVLSRRIGDVEATTLRAVAALTAFFAFFHFDLQRSLLEYQPWQALSEAVRREEPSPRTLVFLGGGWNFSTAFYARRDCSWVELPQFIELVRSGDLKLAVLTENAIEPARAAGLEVTVLQRFATFNTSTPNRAFLNAATRAQTLDWVSLVRVGPKKDSVR